MAQALKDLSASLREAVTKAAALTVLVERRPYPVSGVLIAAQRVLTASHLLDEEQAIEQKLQELKKSSDERWERAEADPGRLADFE